MTVYSTTEILGGRSICDYFDYEILPLLFIAKGVVYVTNI